MENGIKMELKGLQSVEIFEVFTAVKIQVEVFWTMAPCSDMARYQRFRGICCIHLQGEVTLKMEAA
jgi:hypothetical protein